MGFILAAILLVHSAGPPACFPDVSSARATFRMPEGEIGDDFLSFLVATIDSDRTITVDNRWLGEEFPVYRKGSSSVFYLLREVRREKTPGGAELSFSFLEELHVPVPFGILGYHPIWIDTSGSVALRESRFRSRTIAEEDRRPTVITPEYEYRLSSGSASIRVDSWLTVLTVGLLSDFDFRGLSLFRKEEDWYGLLAGTGPDGRPIYWMFDLTRLRIVLPIPREFVALASELVSRDR